MDSSHYLSFPGFNIDWFVVKRVAFTLGKPIYWYGIIIALGFLAGIFLAIHIAKKNNIDSDILYDLIIWAAPFAIIGARVYYVIFSPGSFNSFYDYIAIWDGGIAIYGAVITSIIVALIYCKVKKKSFFRIADTLVPGLLLGQAIGRWGNFFNVEAYGSETTLPWRMGIIEDGIKKFVHPTFLYESLWSIIGVVLLCYYFFKIRKRSGEVLFLYLGWYGLGRFFIEGLRTDSLMFYSFRVSQIVAATCVLLSVAGIIYLRKKDEEFLEEPIIYKETEDTEEEKATPESDFFSEEDFEDIYEADESNNIVEQEINEDEFTSEEDETEEESEGKTEDEIIKEIEDELKEE